MINQHLLFDVGCIAIMAGKKIMEYYGCNEFEFKDDKTPVTKADMASHYFICDALSAISPYPICSEEHILEYEIRKDLEYFWLIDPLDGTKDFLAHNTGFTVNIALIHRNTPILGVIYAPALYRFYCALKNYGAYRIIESIEEYMYCIDAQWLMEHAQKITGARNIQEKELVGCDSVYNSSEATHRFFEKYKLKRIVRGSSLKICSVAEGDADLYVRFNGTREWDTAAGDIILSESGGEMIDYKTKQALIYNKADTRNNHFIAFCKSQVGGKIYEESMKN